MAKYKIDWSKEARLDLLDILGFYVQRNGNSKYSADLFKKINKQLSIISRNPFIGIQTDIDSVRVLITGDYQIIYETFMIRQAQTWMKISHFS